MRKLCLILVLCLLVVGSGEVVVAAPVVHEISVVQSTHGSITPKGVKGVVKVKDGKNKPFTVTPKSGWYAYQILVDGKSVDVKRKGKRGVYTFKKVSADHVISATFLDIQKPSTPKGLVATATSTTEISLSWEALTDNAGSVTYKVYVGGKVKMNATTTSATVSGLESGTKYCFKIAAVDTTGNESKASAQECVSTLTTVIIPPPPVSANTVPVADAGEQQTVIVGDVVQLDGGNSFDSDGDTLTYRWKLSKPEGSNAELSDETAQNPTFVPDVGGVEGDGSYVAWLTVNDGKKNSLSQGVWVKVLPNGYPEVPEADWKDELINFAVNERFATEHADTLAYTAANIVADKNTVLDRNPGNRKHYALSKIMTYPDDQASLYAIKNSPAYFTDNNFVGNQKYGGTTIVFWAQPVPWRVPAFFKDVCEGATSCADRTNIGGKEYWILYIADPEMDTPLLGRENVSGTVSPNGVTPYEAELSGVLHEVAHTYPGVGVPEWYSLTCVDNSGTLPTLGADYNAWYPGDPMAGLKALDIKEYAFTSFNSGMINGNPTHLDIDVVTAASLIRTKVKVVDAAGTPVPNAAITVYGGIKNAGLYGVPANMEEELQVAVTNEIGETPITNNPNWYLVGVKASSGGKYAGAVVTTHVLQAVWQLKQREYVLTLTLQ